VQNILFYILAETDARSSRTVSLRQLNFLYKVCFHEIKPVRWATLVANILSYVSDKYWQNRITSYRVITDTTRCSAIAERPRCRVCYSFRQK